MFGFMISRLRPDLGSGKSCFFYLAGSLKALGREGHVESLLDTVGFLHGFCAAWKP